MSQIAQRPDAKGWCPGAYRPMMSGDGLVVRVRPTLARLTADQTFGLCDLAERHGSGVIDLTNRANLQIRGVRPENHEALLSDLQSLGLLPDDPDLEARRNVLVPPDWVDGDATSTITRELIQRLDELPLLPEKFGFAIDAGTAPMLANQSGDLRIERTVDGLIARADGLKRGLPVTVETAVDQLIEMAHWFIASGGFDAKRMARHLTSVKAPNDWQQAAPRQERARPVIGQHPNGAVYGVAFGQMIAQDLRALLNASGCKALRVTPWRLILTEDAAPVASNTFITDQNDPLLRIDACSGAKGCPAGEFDTRMLARELAGLTEGSLHVSGCAKGCARPRAADVTLVGRDGKIDLVQNGLPWDEPMARALAASELKDRIGDL
ncbi:precorrin-3B synthase [Cognatishimia activa]|uniref:Ferredoxin-nitrite reductase n=1 Tax=Cognatishimia activa TaxID=1715691 RepID=A0A0P1IPY0_9RHOB|nr:precorrin-3B synthase [Cognatishimia activa]CUI89632.1 ferredoxin-nitrite reductase [Cognatishimia activa]CUK25674.1 ferredoxin-nitrite reductase [Cognatishimia activa]